MNLPAGLSVLLVEDEFLIALDATEILKSLGVHKVEVISTFDRAQQCAEHTPFDLAVLDVNLNGTLSFPIADTLRRRGIPVVFASGYHLSEHLPGRFDQALCVGKPYTTDTLKQALLSAIDRQGSAVARS